MTKITPWWFKIDLKNCYFVKNQVLKTLNLMTSSSGDDDVKLLFDILETEVLTIIFKTCGRKLLYLL